MFMKKDFKGLWCIFAIVIICVVMSIFFSKGNDHTQIKDREKETAADSRSEEDHSEEMNTDTVDSYPYYGMSEADLNHCLLGKPMIISECSAFDKLPPEYREKYYYFGYGTLENSAKIIVKYHSDADENDGYVDSGYYIDQEGTEYRLDFDGVVKVEEEAEATTEEAEKVSGGSLRPAGKDTEQSSPSDRTSKKKSTSATTEFDPDDHDIEGYYEDNKDEYDSIDDAYDAFEDDEEAWDDY